MILYSVSNVYLSHMHMDISHVVYIFCHFLKILTFYRYVKHALATNDNSADNLIISQLYQLHSLAFVIKEDGMELCSGTNSMEKEGYGKIIIYWISERNR